MKTGFPLWTLIAVICGVSVLFSSPAQHLVSIAAAASLFLSSHRIGGWICRYFADGAEHPPVQFPVGLGIVLLIVYALGTFSTARPLLLAIWGILFAVSLTNLKLLNKRVPWYACWAAPYVFLTVWSCFTPTTFYDALYYHIGLPNQYLAHNQIKLFPTHICSYYPPLDQVSNLLFMGIVPQSGIKLFSIVLYSQVLILLASAKETERQQKLMIIPLLLLPIPWVLIHLVNSDLLVSLFFVAGGLTILKSNINHRNIALAAVLSGFAAWTKYTVFPFLALLPVLIYSRSDSIVSSTKRIAGFAVLVAMIISPLLIRNYIKTNDPVYPFLASKLTPGWSDAQTTMWEKDSPRPSFRAGLKEAVIAPFYLTFRPSYYGSASILGMLFIVSLLLLPFALAKRDSVLLVHLLLSYLIWIYVLIQFRYYLPAFFLAWLLLSRSFEFLDRVAPRVIPVLWTVGLLAGIFQAAPIYRWFPLIEPHQSANEYLANHLNYFRAAEILNRGRGYSSVFLGETRIAYVDVPLIMSTAYDRPEFLRLTERFSSADELRKELKRRRVKYVLYNAEEFRRLSEKYGVWEIRESQRRTLRDFVRSHTKLVYSAGSIVLLELVP